MVKNLPANAEDTGLIPGSGRSPEGNSNPLQKSCLGNQIGQRSLVGYSPGGGKVRHDLVTKQQQQLYIHIRGVGGEREMLVTSRASKVNAERHKREVL